MQAKFESVDGYIDSFPAAQKQLMQAIRNAHSTGGTQSHGMNQLQYAGLSAAWCVGVFCSLQKSYRVLPNIVTHKSV